MQTLRNLKMDDYQKFISENLFGIDNFELLILKGHILIEYSINLYLEATSKDNNADFFKENFSFADKINILHHFVIGGDRNKNLLQEIHLLNKLRNDIAHTLTFTKKHLDDFYSNLSRKYPKINTECISEIQRFTMAITFICGAIISGYKSHVDKADLELFLKENDE